jgi:nuclease S1
VCSAAKTGLRKANTIRTNAHRLRRTLAALAVSLLITSNALAWGDEGHRVVATIAQMHLTPKATKAVRRILGPDNSLMSVSTWADEIRPSRPDTAPWHYIDIPLKASTIDPQRDCPDGNCVTAAITHFMAVLRNSSSTRDQKSEALKFIIHFVGDLHQPLHCADNNDRGGNEASVTFFGEPSNLHAVWDTLLIERIDPDSKRYATMLNAEIKGSDIATWEDRTVEDWALESHAVAQKVAYGALPAGKVPDLGKSYFAIAAPAVDHQLEKAGIRLAYILNQIFQ